MLYLISALLSVLAVSGKVDVQRRLAQPMVEDLVMERNLLDEISFKCGMGAYDGVFHFFGMSRRLEDPTERLNHIITKIDKTPRRRIICGGLCIAVAAAVAGGVAGGATTGLIGLAGNSVTAPDLDISPEQVEQLAEVAAQGAFDAVENQFGIQGVEAFGDALAQVMDMHRRPPCLGLCTAVIAAVAGGVASGVTGGIIAAATSISAEDLNIDAGMEISQFALEQVANIEKGTIDLITEIGAQGAMNSLQNLFN